MSKKVSIFHPHPVHNILKTSPCTQYTLYVMTKKWQKYTYQQKVKKCQYFIRTLYNIMSLIYFSGSSYGKSVQINPFDSMTCAGIQTADQVRYSMTLMYYRVNYWNVLMTFFGLGLYIYAPILCRNGFFQYSTGILTGVSLSLIVIVYFMQRKPLMCTSGGRGGYPLFVAYPLPKI